MEPSHDWVVLLGKGGGLCLVLKNNINIWGLWFVNLTFYIFILYFYDELQYYNYD